MTYNAEQAKKEAENQRKIIGEREHLQNHFESLITNAVKEGKNTTGKIVFAKDRFAPSLIFEVLKVFKDKNFKVLEGTNNAQQQIVLEFTWT